MPAGNDRKPVSDELIAMKKILAYLIRSNASLKVVKTLERSQQKI